MQLTSAFFLVRTVRDYKGVRIRPRTFHDLEYVSPAIPRNTSTYLDGVLLLSADWFVGLPACWSSYLVTTGGVTYIYAIYRHDGAQAYNSCQAKLSRA